MSKLDEGLRHKVDQGDIYTFDVIITCVENCEPLISHLRSKGHEVGTTLLELQMLSAKLPKEEIISIASRDDVASIELDEEARTQ